MTHASLDIASTEPNTQMPARIVAAGLSLIALAVVFVIDKESGGKMSVLPLYLVPVTLGAWLGSRVVGIPMTILSGVAWMLAQYTTDTPAFEGWDLVQNGVMRMVVFSVMCFLVLRMSALRQTSDDLARLDPMTGLGNRAAFFYRATISLGQAAVRAQPVSMVVVDIDRLHEINTRFGQQRGDLVISLAAHAVRAVKRPDDSVARTSGDEFVLFLPQTGEPAARALCDLLRVSLDRVSSLAGCEVRFNIVLVLASRAPLAIEDMLNVGEGELRMADGFRSVKFTEAARGAG